jgi:hypothetical protein
LHIRVFFADEVGKKYPTDHCFCGLSIIPHSIHLLRAQLCQ